MKVVYIYNHHLCKICSEILPNEDEESEGSIT
jgi:hypothetical protein